MAETLLRISFKSLAILASCSLMSLLGGVVVGIYHYGVIAVFINFSVVKNIDHPGGTSIWVSTVRNH